MSQSRLRRSKKQQATSGDLYDVQQQHHQRQRHNQIPYLPISQPARIEHVIPRRPIDPSGYPRHLRQSLLPFIRIHPRLKLRRVREAQRRQRQDLLIPKIHSSKIKTRLLNREPSLQRIFSHPRQRDPLLRDRRIPGATIAAVAERISSGPPRLRSGSSSTRMMPCAPSRSIVARMPSGGSPPSSHRPTPTENPPKSGHTFRLRENFPSTSVVSAAIRPSP